VQQCLVLFDLVDDRGSREAWPVPNEQADFAAGKMDLRFPAIDSWVCLAV